MRLLPIVILISLSACASVPRPMPEEREPAPQQKAKASFLGFLLSGESPKAEEPPKEEVPSPWIVMEGEVSTLMAEQMISAIKTREEAGLENIIIEINSPGGSVDDGFRIAKAIERTPMKVTCIVDGEGESMAFYILQSCDHRAMTKRSILMVHGPSIVGNLGGNWKYWQEYADYLKNLGDAMFEHIASRMGISVYDLKARVDRDAWYMGWQEAKEFGAVDDVVDMPHKEL